MIQTQTPRQREMPQEIQRLAYGRIPETCPKVQEILVELKADIMERLGIDAAEDAAVDAAIAHAFCRIRDEVTHPFRDEQMIMLKAADARPGRKRI